MLTKKQLEDAARCTSSTKCWECKMMKTDQKGDCTENVAQTALVYREMLERLEWSGLSGYSTDKPIWYCVVCGRRKEKGHAAYCELAALLKESEGEEG